MQDTRTKMDQRSANQHSGLVLGYTKILKLKFDQPKSSFNMLVKHLVKWFLNLCGF